MLVEDGALVGVAARRDRARTGGSGKLELSTADGLLSLHLEGDTLHGNVVRPTGMEHVALPWSERRPALVVGTPATAAAAARLLGDRIGIGQGQTVSGVSVDVHLGVRRATFRVARVGPRGWWFVTADTGQQTGVTLDLDGIPLLADARALAAGARSRPTEGSPRRSFVDRLWTTSANRAPNSGISWISPLWAPPRAA